MRTPIDDILRVVPLFYSPVEGERHNAVDAFYRTLLRQGIHINDLRFSVGNSVLDNLDELTRILQDRLVASARENEYWRRNAKDGELKRALEATNVDYRWYDLEDMIRERITGDPEGEPLMGGWMKKICCLLEINNGTLKRWMAGTEQIPDAAFGILNRQPVVEQRKKPKSTPDSGAVKVEKAPKQPRRTSSGPGKGKNYWPWDATPGAFRAAADAFAKGLNCEGIADLISKQFGNRINGNQITELIYNNPPREMFGVNHPDSNLELGWLEAWEIFSRLEPRGKGWWSRLHQGMRREVVPPIPIPITPDKIRELRQRYLDWKQMREDMRLDQLRVDTERMMQKATPKSDFLKAIVEAGPRGLTVDEAKEKLGWTGHHVAGNHGRTGELVRQFLIFKIGKQPGRDGDVWVSTEFGDHHPKEFAVAKAARNIKKDENHAE